MVLMLFYNQNSKNPDNVFNNCPWRYNKDKEEICVWDTPDGCLTFHCEGICVGEHSVIAYKRIKEY